MSTTMIQRHRLLARPGLIKDFKDTYQDWEEIYNQYAKVGSHDKPEIHGTIVTGPNRLIQTRELEPVTYFEVKTGPKVSAVDKTYKGGYALSKESIDDDGYGKLNQGAKWLARSLTATRLTPTVLLRPSRSRSLASRISWTLRVR